MTAVLRLRNGLRPAHQGPENPLLCRLRNNLLARSREVRHDYMLSKPPHSDLTSRTVITDVIIGAQEADLSSCCDAAAFSNCSSMQLESEMPMSVGIPRVDQACIIDVEGTSETRVRSQRRLMRHNRCALEATARRERPNWMSATELARQLQDGPNRPAIVEPSRPLSDRKECAICLTNIDAQDMTTKFPCDHFFHLECTNPWLKDHDTCPCCRTRLATRRPDNGQNAVFGGSSWTATLNNALLDIAIFIWGLIAN